MSNEHPNMHGNFADAPVLCDYCHNPMRDDEGGDVDGFLGSLVCSTSCAEGFLQKQVDRLTKELQQARDAFDSLYATEHKRHADLHVLTEIGQRLLVAWNGGAFAVEVSVRPAVVDAFDALRKTIYEHPLTLHSVQSTEPPKPD